MNCLEWLVIVVFGRGGTGGLLRVPAILNDYEKFIPIDFGKFKTPFALFKTKTRYKSHLCINVALKLEERVIWGQMRLCRRDSYEYEWGDTGDGSALPLPLVKARVMCIRFTLNPNNNAFG